MGAGLALQYHVFIACSKFLIVPLTVE